MLKKKLIEEKYNVKYNHKHNIDNYKKKLGYSYIKIYPKLYQSTKNVKYHLKKHNIQKKTI